MDVVPPLSRPLSREGRGEKSGLSSVHSSVCMLATQAPLPWRERGWGEGDCEHPSPRTPLTQSHREVKLGVAVLAVDGDQQGRAFLVEFDLQFLAGLAVPDPAAV